MNGNVDVPQVPVHTGASHVYFLQSSRCLYYANLNCSIVKIEFPVILMQQSNISLKFLSIFTNIFGLIHRQKQWRADPALIHCFSSRKRQQRKPMHKDDRINKLGCVGMRAAVRWNDPDIFGLALFPFPFPFGATSVIILARLFDGWDVGI